MCSSCPCSPAWSSCYQTDEWWLDQSRESVLSPRNLSLPPWHCGSSSSTGCRGRSLALEHVYFGDRDQCWLTPWVFLPPQATGPFLHIGAVGGMTLLAWPLASFIYRTHSTGNGPPKSPLVPLAGALPPATHLSSTVGRCSGSISAVGTGLQCGSNACSWLRLMTSPCCSFSPPCLAAEGGIQVAECCRSAELGKGM